MHYKGKTVVFYTTHNSTTITLQFCSQSVVIFLTPDSSVILAGCLVI